MKSWIECRWRGVLSSVVIGAAALFVSNTYGSPTVLYALLLGMAFHFISEDDRAVAGIELCAKNFLRIGVGLLGARITAEELAQLSLGSITVLITGVFATVAFSMLLNRWIKWPRAEGALAGASVAICGASAAAALALVIDKKALREQALLAIIVTVTALSTISMILYPILCELLGFESSRAGLLLGGTIHDVAQVVGAGAMLGNDALQTATMTKMLRVAMLIPMMFVFTALFAAKGKHGEPNGPKTVNPFAQIPLFLDRLRGARRTQCRRSHPDVGKRHACSGLAASHSRSNGRARHQNEPRQAQGRRLGADHSDDCKHRLSLRLGSRRHPAFGLTILRAPIEAPFCCFHELMSLNNSPLKRRCLDPMHRGPIFQVKFS